jgi:hypothetical protein
MAMRPVPYRLYRQALRLLQRTVINLVLVTAATLITGFLVPRAHAANDDTPTALKLVETLTSFLLWVIIMLSILIFVGVALLHAYAQIAGVAPPGPEHDADDPR